MVNSDEQQTSVYDSLDGIFYWLKGKWKCSIIIAKFWYYFTENFIHTSVVCYTWYTLEIVETNFEESEHIANCLSKSTFTCHGSNWNWLYVINFGEIVVTVLAMFELN